MKDLTTKHCIPCEGGVEPMAEAEYRPYLELVPDWQVQEGRKINRLLLFKDFRSALSFVQKVGELAEAEGHHPDISLHNWNKVTLTLTTHAIAGLSQNDFIMAVKIDRIPKT